MKAAVFACILIALVSIAIGTVYSFTIGNFLGRITPRALLIFSGIALLFGINFALLELIEK